MSTWTGWLKQGGKWRRAVAGADIEDVHARLLAEAERRGLPLTTGTRLITRGGKGETPRAEGRR